VIAVWISSRPGADPVSLSAMSAELPEEFPPDFEFGAYVIRVCIGRGGMARIYRAEQATLNRPVALKVLDRWVLDQPTGKERFLREAKAAASIKHPHVVDILDVGLWRDRPFIVMELLVGCDLDTYLDRFGTLSEREIASLALPLIAGVMAVHDAGVVHRDLKPSNIFLSNGPDGVVVPKVLDFGVSKFSNTLNDPLLRATKTREIIGTPTYMAPEALEGVRALGPAGDQYALGAVLYECAVGRPPFEGETLLELLKAVAMGKIEPPSALRPEISPPLEQAILRAIERDPNARFATLREMGRALWPLADARTQTIWQPSFGNGRVAGVFADAAAPTLAGHPRTRRGEQTRPRERSFARRLLTGRYGWGWSLILALALGALGALAFVLSSHPQASSARALLAANPPSAAARGTHFPVSAGPSPGTSAPAPLDGHASPSLSATDAPSLPSAPGAAASPRSTSSSGAPQRAGASAPSATPQNGAARSGKRRAASAPSASDRRAAASAKAASASGESDPAQSELDGLFVEPRENSRTGKPSSNEAELDGLFPGTGSMARGANGSPIPE
jgi:tRNA A-37 threonylcarbamoyl transferase component Bud32